jgi:hypothetical protein
VLSPRTGWQALACQRPSDSIHKKTLVIRGEIGDGMGLFTCRRAELCRWHAVGMNGCVGMAYTMMVVGEKNCLALCSNDGFGCASVISASRRALTQPAKTNEDSATPCACTLLCEVTQVFNRSPGIIRRIAGLSDKCHKRVRFPKDFFHNFQL